MAADIPAVVERFIADHIDSVELLEVLFLLRRNPQKEWSAEEVSERLYTSPGSAANRLQALRASRLAGATDGPQRTTYRYAPADDELARTVAAVEEVYAVRRTTVINMIFSKPADNLRTFADAFRLREDK